LILAVDPGTSESAYVITGKNLKPLEFGKVDNYELLKLIEDGHSWEALHEGYEIVKKVLQRNKNIGDAFYEGISKVYW
jgi:hypothetical protein